MSNRVDLDKDYRTKNGLQTRLYAIDTNFEGGRVIGMMRLPTGVWTSFLWDLEGRGTWGNEVENDSPFSLVEIGPKEKVAYINFYRDQKVFSSRDEADKGALATRERVACIRVDYWDGVFHD